MSGPRTAGSGLRPRHELLEHYTPDGALGRLLLAAVAGSVGGTALFLALAFVVETVPFWPILALAASAVGLAGVGLALVVLWPVYLSLIGNVESASAYPGGGATRPTADLGDRHAADFDAADTGLDAADGGLDTADGGLDTSDAADPDDAVALLQRRYAAGEISEEEFERRVDDLLGVDAALDSHRAGSEREERRRRENHREAGRNR